MKPAKKYERSDLGGSGILKGLLGNLGVSGSSSSVTIPAPQATQPSLPMVQVETKKEVSLDSVPVESVQENIKPPLEKESVVPKVSLPLREEVPVQSKAEPVVEAKKVEVSSEASHPGQSIPPWVARQQKVSDRLVSTEKKEVLPPINLNQYPYPEGFKGSPAKSTGENMSENAEKVAPINSRKNEGHTLEIPTAERTLAQDLEMVTVDAKAEKITTVIAAACENKGDISTKEGVMVKGVQVGNISVDLDGDDATGTVVVTRNGVVRGHIEGKRVVVFGRVEGSIRSVSHLTLAENSVVTGDVSYRVIRMLDGSEIEGNCMRIKESDL